MQTPFNYFNFQLVAKLICVQKQDVYLQRLALGEEAESIAHLWFQSNKSFSRASNLEWTSKINDSAGYDFLVSSNLVFSKAELSGRNMLCRVEVKGFSDFEPADFFISRNELEVMLNSKSQGYEYVILLVLVGDSKCCGLVHSWLEKDALDSVDVRSKWSQAQVHLRDIPGAFKRACDPRINSVQAQLTSSSKQSPSSVFLELSSEEEQLRQAILLSSLESDSALNLLSTNLRCEELSLHDVNTEGHCQFDAVAHQIRRFHASYPNLDGAKTYTYQQVRADLSCWLRCPQASCMENFLESETHGKDWVTFCDRVENPMSVQGVLWGDHLTLIAAASKYERPIRVWLSAASTASTAGGENCHFVDIRGLGKAEPLDEQGPFQIAHVYERHFMSVVPILESSDSKPTNPHHSRQRGNSKRKNPVGGPNRRRR